MNILTNYNKPFSMNSVPDDIDDLMYNVLDVTKDEDIDYHFLPLIWLEKFTATAARLRIGKYEIQMPMDWHMLIVALDQVEIIKIENLMDKGFQAFCLNPIDSYTPEFLTVEVVEIYSDIDWHFPDLRYGHILTVPLSDGEKPLCAFFVKDAHKIHDVYNIGNLL